jgi:hypothetical protein
MARSVSVRRHRNETAIKPAAPTNLAAPVDSITTTQVGLRFGPAAVAEGGPPLQGYYVYQGGTKVLTLGPSDLTPTITGLTPGVEYVFGVSGFNADGEGPMSALVTVATLGAQGPGAPDSFRFTSRGETTAVVAWDAATAPDADPVQGYRIRRVGATAVLATTTADVLTANLTGLVDGDQLQVKAYNTVGQGPQSNVLTFSPGIIVNPVDGMSAVRVGKILDLYSIAALFQNQDELYGDYTATKTALVDLGIKHIRGRFTPVSTTLLNNWRDLAQTQGIRILCRFGAIETSDAGQDTPAELIQKLVNNFGETAANPNRDLLDYICAIEGWNEPNNNGYPWITRTVRYTRLTYEAWFAELQTRNRIPLTGPALARIPSDRGGAEGGSLLGQSQNFAAAAEAVHGVAGAGLRPWVTKGVTHIYPLGSSPSTDYDYFTPIARATTYPAPLQMMTTEGGYFTNIQQYPGGSNPTPEHVAGFYHDRQIMEHFIRNSLYFNLHELWDTFTSPTETSDRVIRENSFGLLRHDKTKKPGYFTIKNFLALVRDLNPNLTPKTTGFTPANLPVTISPAPGEFDNRTNRLRAVLAQHSDGTYRLILWRDINVTWNATSPYRVTPLAAQNVTVTFSGGARTVTEYMPSKQATPTVAAASKTSHTVPLSDSLTVLVIA